MAEQVCNPNFDKALPLIGRDENLKYLFDRIMQGGLTQDADERRDARRRASNDAAYDKALDTVTVLGIANSMIASQVGEDDTETASGTEETADDAVSTANAQVAANIAQLASALVPIIAGTSGVVSVQTLSAVLAAVVTAAGTAAQNAQPVKPTAGAAA